MEQQQKKTIHSEQHLLPTTPNTKPATPTLTGKKDTFFSHEKAKQRILI